jgi:Uma2 family endonuclease
MNTPAHIDFAAARPVDEHLFNAREFEAMVACGAFADIRAELVGGAIEKMAPALGEHAFQNADIVFQLKLAYRDCPVWIGIDLMIKIDDTEVRAADVAVCDQDAPKDALVLGHQVQLLVEIADSTLRRDRVLKPASYAPAGVAEYWVVDLKGRSTRIFTEPGADGYARYRDVPFGEPMMPPGANETVTIG